MWVITQKKLKEFYETPGREDAKNALRKWLYIAKKASWKNLNDIRKDFPATDYAGNQRYVFNIRGNNYRMVVIIKFVAGLIYIRFVGTHEEYDKIDCSTI